jgi:hypothetical protein
MSVQRIADFSGLAIRDPIDWGVLCVVPQEVGDMGLGGQGSLGNRRHSPAARADAGNVSGRLGSGGATCAGPFIHCLVTIADGYDRPAFSSPAHARWSRWR